jgi:hypothetical protein
VVDGKGLGFAADAWMPLGWESMLRDLGQGRIDLMDKAGIDYAVLSLTSPGAEQFEPALGTSLAKASNDILRGYERMYGLPGETTPVGGREGIALRGECAESQARLTGPSRATPGARLAATFSGRRPRALQRRPQPFCKVSDGIGFL